MYELRRLQHGDRPVTGQGNKEVVENFFSRALNTDPSAPSTSSTEQQRPESVVVEVNALVERRPVSSILQSSGFRRNLESALRGAIAGNLARRSTPPSRRAASSREAAPPPQQIRHQEQRESHDDGVSVTSQSSYATVSSEERPANGEVKGCRYTYNLYGIRITYISSVILCVFFCGGEKYLLYICHF